MEDRLVDLIIGALLHDIGKIVHRTGLMKSHSTSGWEFLQEKDTFKDNNNIKEGVKYHHGRELSKAKLEEDSLAYLVYMADNISAAGDRRLEFIEGEESQGAIFNKGMPLASVFNILNGNDESYSYNLKTIEKINYPRDGSREYTTVDYTNILQKIREQIAGIEVKEEYINSILHLLESTTSYIPSSTNTKELGDISLYDHSKTTAAIASCLYYYLEDKNYKKTVFDKGKEFYMEDAYLLYSADISGIQNYIYFISGTKALKSLRTRSLYLEILLENLVDELLSKLGLSRCNLLYTGGGHAYLLLPNTEKVKKDLLEFESEIKNWFLEQFDISLFIASAYAECNSKDLSNDIGKVYKKVGKNISKKKTNRYSAEDIIRLNSFKRVKEDRECRECKKSGPVNLEGLCPICQNLIDISPKITKADTYFVVSEKLTKDFPFASLALPFNQVLEIKTKEEILEGEYIRVYSKNQPSMGYKFATNLWVGDYTKRSKVSNNIKDFSEFAKESRGLERIGVLRADVDNLGQAFVRGFSKEKNQETLSRTSSLSRQLSIFFKYYINEILGEKDRNALIIYSGGDDMFIVGSWNDCIELAKDIRLGFKKFTQNTLTISAGIGIYSHTYPIARIAKEVGELENAAKTKDENKDKVTLFRKAKIGHKREVLEEDWVLKWEQLPSLENRESQEGIEGKLNELRRVFDRDQQSGKAFLYKVLDLLRNSSDKINIARYAYLLKRAQERNRNLNVQKFYKYINDERERKELEIAITLYSYETR